MRTTSRLDDALLQEAKQEAARSEMTLDAFIEEALRQRLARTARVATAQAPVRLKTFRGRGLCPGVDLDRSAALQDRMDDA